MSASTVKQARRQLRRAAGEGALHVVSELQGNVERLANSLALAHKRNDDLALCCAKLEARIVALESK
jgi:small ligand-binding sensory domain FIST